MFLNPYFKVARKSNKFWGGIETRLVKTGGCFVAVKLHVTLFHVREERIMRDPLNHNKMMFNERKFDIATQEINRLFNKWSRKGLSWYFQVHGNTTVNSEKTYASIDLRVQDGASVKMHGLLRQLACKVDSAFCLRRQDRKASRTSFHVSAQATIAALSDPIGRATAPEHDREESDY